jgi:hypothetical protein
MGREAVCMYIEELIIYSRKELTKNYKLSDHVQLLSGHPDGQSSNVELATPQLLLDHANHQKVPHFERHVGPNVALRKPTADVSVAQRQLLFEKFLRGRLESARGQHDFEQQPIPDSADDERRERQATDFDFCAQRLHSIFQEPEVMSTLFIRFCEVQ